MAGQPQVRADLDAAAAAVWAPVATASAGERAACSPPPRSTSGSRMRRAVRQHDIDGADLGDRVPRAHSHAA